MIRNRSAPPASVVPVLVYPDVGVAVEWLTRVFGLVERVRIGDHRAQLAFGDGAVIVADPTHGRHAPTPADAATHSIMVRVDDVDEHWRRAAAAGAKIVAAPADLTFGERQYRAVDLSGRHWTFTQSVADLHPQDWGGTAVSDW